MKTLLKVTLISYFILFICFDIHIGNCEGVKRTWEREIPEKELIDMLEEDKYWNRSTAMDYIADALEDNKMVLRGKLKEICYRIIRNHINGKADVDTREDDEGHYAGSVSNLAAAINDKEFLPYFLRCIPGDSSVRAIAKQGDEAINELINMANNTDLSEMRKISIIHSMRDIVNYKKNGYAISSETIKKIYDKAIQLYENTPYSLVPVSKESDEKLRRRMERQSAVKENILWLLADIGDKDVIPFIKEVSKNDKYYRMATKKNIRYFRMTEEERKRYVQQHAKEIVAEASAGVKKQEKKYKYYTIREEAKKVLKELEK